jgi:hypothetical protein
MSLKTIENGFRKNTRYDIRKSEKNENQIITVSNPEDFVEYYNDFSRRKYLPLIKKENFMKIYHASNIKITSIINSNNTLAMHSYILDKKIGRVRLWYSASIFRSYDKKDKKRLLVAIANKNLHFKDMEYFKNEGYIVYDFGGYAYQSNDPTLLGINNFKDQFGGKLIKEANYSSFLFSIAKQFKN